MGEASKTQRCRRSETGPDFCVLGPVCQVWLAKVWDREQTKGMSGSDLTRSPRRIGSRSLSEFPLDVVRIECERCGRSRRYASPGSWRGSR